jgi:dATP/dGTP diphosphohydrolase, N-terminal
VSSEASPDTDASAPVRDHPYFQPEDPNRFLCAICNLGPPSHVLGIADSTYNIRDYLKRVEVPEDADAGRIQEQEEDPTRILHSTTDATIWSRYFMQIFGDKKEEIDEGLMIGWFANAFGTAEMHMQKEEQAIGLPGDPGPIDREAIMDREGHKDDQGKAPWHFIPWEGLEEVAYVMEHGAVKYRPGNYRNGMDLFRLMRAGIGHWVDWWRGEDNDPETGRSHIAHSVCCGLMALESIKVGTARDTRFTKR